MTLTLLALTPPKVQKTDDVPFDLLTSDFADTLCHSCDCGGLEESHHFYIFSGRLRGQKCKLGGWALFVDHIGAFCDSHPLPGGDGMG